MPFEIYSFKIVNAGNSDFILSIPFCIESYNSGQWEPYMRSGGELPAITIHPGEEYQQETLMMARPTLWPGLLRINKDLYDWNNKGSPFYIVGTYYFFPGYIWFIITAFLLPIISLYRRKYR